MCEGEGGGRWKIKLEEQRKKVSQETQLSKLSSKFISQQFLWGKVIKVAKFRLKLTFIVVSKFHSETLILININAAIRIANIFMCSLGMQSHGYFLI